MHENSTVNISNIVPTSRVRMVSKLNFSLIENNKVVADHEPSSPARTPGSWVRITLEAWMPVCVHSVFVLFCV
jgi:hypothetical protein